MKNYRLLLIGILALTLLIALPVITPAQAQCTNTVGAITECPAAGIEQIAQLMTRMISISVTIAFISLTIWLIWGAIKFFITSGGDPKALSHAWASVTWSFMGLFFMVLAWLSLKLIFAVTGADVTQFCLGFPPYCV